MILITSKSRLIARRFYANVLDYVIVSVVIIAYIFLTGEERNGGYTVTGWGVLFVPLLWTVYFPGLESLLGYTPGKRSMHFVVSDDQGRKPSFIQAFLRRAFDLFELSFFGLPSIFSIHFSARNQRLGDKIADTYVVETAGKCSACHAEVELTAKESIFMTFRCPSCNHVNTPTSQPTAAA